MECTGTRIGKEAHSGLNDAFRGKADGGVEPCRVLGRQVGFGGIGDGDGAFEFVHRVGPSCAQGCVGAPEFLLERAPIAHGCRVEYPLLARGQARDLVDHALGYAQGKSQIFSAHVAPQADAAVLRTAPTLHQRRAGERIGHKGIFRTDIEAAGSLERRDVPVVVQFELIGAQQDAQGAGRVGANRHQECVIGARHSAGIGPATRNRVAPVDLLASARGGRDRCHQGAGSGGEELLDAFVGQIGGKQAEDSALVEGEPTRGGIQIRDAGEEVDLLSGREFAAAHRVGNLGQRDPHLTHQGGQGFGRSTLGLGLPGEGLEFRRVLVQGAIDALNGGGSGGGGGGFRGG